MPIEMREWASDNLTIPERCIRNGLTTFGNHTMERFTKLLVLEYLTSSFYLLPPYLLLNVARATDRIEVSIMFDLPDSLSKHENEYLLYLERCETILHGLSALAEAIDFMVEILAQQTPEGFDSPKLVQENEAILIVQRLCHQRLNNVRRSIERLNRAFEGRNKALNIQESLSVKRLTVLAAIFIPLSLSSSLLSMQTRFVHLHLLLYDFIGMFVILSTFALLLFFLITQALRLKRSNLWWTLSLSSLWADRERSKVEKSDIPAEAQRDKKRNFYYWLTKLLSTCLLIFYLLIWSVVLVSFIVGMTFKVVLGLKILGYGFAGLLIYVILVFVLLVSVITATGGNIVEKCYYWEATVPSASW
jgi:hypothetical protein